MIAQTLVEAAFLDACAEELAALKPGDVHIHAPGHGMTTRDFQLSAEAASPHICANGQRLGVRILDAVTATRARVSQNTNLGIVLLCAPLAIAAEQDGDNLRSGVADAIASSDQADADAVFRAISLANPGGLGDAAHHDVREPALVLLPVAMAKAQHRDSIARQWSNGFADIFGIGVATYAAAIARSGDETWAATVVYLTFLSTFPDSHIMRKHGAATAEEVRVVAARYRDRLSSTAGTQSLATELLKWDASLKARSINPGTSADLTVATGFAWRLGNILRSVAVDGSFPTVGR